MRNLRLAATHVTDLIQLDFAAVDHPDLDSAAIVTIGHALKLAGAEVLELDHRELGVVAGPVGLSAHTGLQLFDNTAGGAGHVIELAALGDAWLRKALEVMYRNDRHHSECVAGCIQCLLTTSSQADFEAGRLPYAVRSPLGRKKLLPR